MNIIQYPNPILLQKSAEVTEPIDQQTIDDMASALGNTGIALAAVQVGILKRFFILANPDGTIQTIVNPVILEKTSWDYTSEGCLSFPGAFAAVKRAFTITVSYFDQNLQNNKVETLQDIKAQAFQHEIDHMDGILFIDKLKPAQRSLIKGNLLKRRKQ